MKKIRVQEYNLPVIIEAEPLGGYFASCPSWDACFAQAETPDQAIIEITYVAQALLDIYREENLPIPLEPKPDPRKIKVDLPVTVAA